MKKYLTPELEIIIFRHEEIMDISIGDDDGAWPWGIIALGYDDNYNR